MDIFDLVSDIHKEAIKEEKLEKERRREIKKRVTERLKERERAKEVEREKDKDDEEVLCGGGGGRFGISNKHLNFWQIYINCLWLLRLTWK